MKRRTRWTVAVALGLGAVLVCSGCKKDDSDFDQIGSPAVDVDALRQKAREKKAQGQQPGQPQRPQDH